jgi:hypothetical protein
MAVMQRHHNDIQILLLPVAPIRPQPLGLLPNPNAHLSHRSRTLHFQHSTHSLHSLGIPTTRGLLGLVAQPKYEGYSVSSETLDSTETLDPTVSHITPDPTSTPATLGGSCQHGDDLVTEADGAIAEGLSGTSTLQMAGRMVGTGQTWGDALGVGKSERWGGCTW